MKNKIYLKRAVIISDIVTIIAIILLTIVGLAFKKRINTSENSSLARLVAAVEEKYPKLAKEELADLLREAESDPKIGKNVLSKYGYDIEGESWIKETKGIVRILLFSSIGILLLAAAGINAAYLMYNRRKDYEISSITSLIEEINKRNYSLEIDSLTEDELSILKNEIYKTTILLKESADNSIKEKENLKKSLSDISHQLKTPLTSILINIENVIKDEEMEPAIRKRFLHQILRDSEAINFMIQNLLKLSRFDTNTIEFRRSETKIKDILDNAEENVGAILDLKDIRLVRNTDENMILYCDKKWECEAISNLLKNAAEHSNPGSEIEIKTEDKRLYKEIRIIDHGTGINEKDLPHIFERFYKDENSGNDSVGIGLPLSREIIEKDNGKIRVESKEGAGTTFILQFF